MTSTYDFAIFGGNALAGLVAGLLAHDHNKQVLLIADPISPQRLPRSVDLAFCLSTRPLSWKMLRRGVGETLALMTSLGAPKSIEPVAVRVATDLPTTRAALAHIAATARGYGQSSRGDVFPWVPRLSGTVSLAGSRVVTVDRDAARLDVGRASGAQLLISGERADIGQIVFADDADLLDLVPADQRPLPLALRSMTATLTAPTRRLPAPIMVFPDRSVALQQRADLSILALAGGDSDVEARLASTLPGPFPLPRLATTHFRRVVASDGAPMIGRVKPSKLMVLAGLGDAAAFFAPIVARFLAGVPADDEKQWIATLSPSRPRDAIADFVAGVA